MSFDLLIRGGTVKTPAGWERLDAGIAAGRIAELAPELSGGAREEIDARGLHIFPGVIYAHVHFNDPGRAHWEGIETGSRALAAGGGTLYFDMPLNAHPPTLDADAERKPPPPPLIVAVRNALALICCHNSGFRCPLSCNCKHFPAIECG